MDNWKLHDSIHHLKSSFVKKTLVHQFTFSLVPEVRAFGSGSTEAAISEKGNDGKFDAVTFYVEQRISIDEDDPLIKLWNQSEYLGTTICLNVTTPLLQAALEMQNVDIL